MSIVNTCVYKCEEMSKQKIKSEFQWTKNNNEYETDKNAYGWLICEMFMLWFDSLFCFILKEKGSGG